MDLGRVMGIDGLVSSSSEIGVGGGCGAFSSSLVSPDIDSITQRGLYRSGFLKQARSGGPDEGDWRYPKVPRSELAMLTPAKASPSLLSPDSHSLFPDGQHMLSFSSPKPDGLVLCNDGASPYYHPSAPSLPSASLTYARNAGKTIQTTGACQTGLVGIAGSAFPSFFEVGEALVPRSFGVY